MAMGVQECFNHSSHAFCHAGLDQASHRNRSRIDCRFVCATLHAGELGHVAQPALKRDKKQARELQRQKWISQLTAYIRESKVAEAEELAQKIRRSGLHMDLWLYNSLITINGRANRFTSAQAWLYRLEAEEWIQPDAVTFRSMIGACGRAGALKEALSYYERMKTCGFSISNQNFNTLLSLHRKAKEDIDWEERVLNLLADMKVWGCCPDSSTVDIVVKLYERFGKLERLSAALCAMESAGWLPSKKCLDVLVKAYVRCGMADEALDMFLNLTSCEGRCTLLKGNSLLGIVHNKDELTQSLSSKISLDLNGDASISEGWIKFPALDEAMCHSLICLCRTSGRYTEAMQVYNVMRCSGTNPSWITASTVIDVCSRLNDAAVVGKGKALFEEMRSNVAGRNETDAGAYMVTINMFLKAGLLEDAAQVADMVAHHQGLVLDSALFLAMLRAYSRSGMSRKAVQVYKKMLGVRMTWTSSMFNGVIHCCGRTLPIEETIKVFLAMVYAKVPLSSATCNLMMDIYAKAGLLDKAENVFKLAKAQAVLDAISYSTIIAAYGKYKEFNKMELALLDMQNSGFKDNVEAYNSMIDAYGKTSQLRRMENVLERMKKADCPPNLSTYNTLINVYGREGLFDELENVRAQMAEANVKPDSYTFNTLIFAYGNSEMPDEAVQAFNEMQDLGLVPNEVTYNCLISAFEKSRNYLEVARWSVWMKQLGLK